MRAFLVDLWSHRGFRYTFLTVAIIAAFWLLLHLVLNWSGEKRWQRIKTQLEAEGETFDFYALYPPPIPDDQNFCAIEPLNGIRTPEGSSPDALAAHKKRDAIKDMAKILRPPDGTELYMATSSNPFGTGAAPDSEMVLKEVRQRKLLQMSGDQDSWPELLQALEAAYPILPLCCHAADERRYAEFLPRLKREEHPANLQSLKQPHQIMVMELLQLMRLYHLVCLRSGNPDQAARCVLVGLRLGSAVQLEPMVISSLAGAVAEGNSYNWLWCLLKERSSSDSHLKRFTDELRGISTLNNHRRVYRGELCSIVSAIEVHESDLAQRWDFARWVISGELMPSASTAKVELSKLVPDGLLKHWKAAYVELCWSGILQPLKQNGFHGVYDRVGLFESTLEARVGWQDFDVAYARLILTSCATITRMAVYGENLRLQSILACALERHLLRHGSYPATLEALDPEFRGKNDLLDVNGEKLHYTLVPGGRYRLWSPGPDGRDDGGKFGVELGGSRQPSSPNYLGDWVWRYDPAVKAP